MLHKNKMILDNGKIYILKFAQLLLHPDELIKL